MSRSRNMIGWCMKTCLHKPIMFSTVSFTENTQNSLTLLPLSNILIFSTISQLQVEPQYNKRFLLTCYTCSSFSSVNGSTTDSFRYRWKTTKVMTENMSRVCPLTNSVYLRTLIAKDTIAGFLNNISITLIGKADARHPV